MRKRESAGALSRAKNFVLSLLVCAPRVLADGYTVSVAPDTRQFNFPGGESQSAVVAPGKKSQCPNGRVLASDDWTKPPLAQLGPADLAVVHWRNLTGPKKIIGPGAGISRFFAPTLPKPAGGAGPGPVQSPQSQRLWEYGSADHQLVALPNGDLLYQLQTFTRETMKPKPEWSDVTFRGGFGPGARTTLATWRSTDCGQTFEFLTDIDSYIPGNEDCASPQQIGGSLSPPFDMGGTDGPNLVVAEDGTAYAVFPCVGRILTKDAAGKLQIVKDGWIKKTFVFTLKPGAKSFVNRGSYSPAFWGPPAVPLSGNRIAVGLTKILAPASQAGVMVGTAQTSQSPFKFTQPAKAVADATWGWEQHADDFPWDLPRGTDLQSRVGTGIGGNTVLARVTAKTEMLLLAFPAMVERTAGKPDTKTRAYRVFFFDPNSAAADPFVETDPVFPVGSAAKSVVMQPAAVSPAQGGPLLLYWYDLDGAANTGRIRGRVIYNATKVSEDFDIARAGGSAAPFAIPPLSSPYWFGDYKTAGAFHDPAVKFTKLGFPIHTYRYFPLWVQPDGTVRFTEVTVTHTITKNFFEEKLTKEPNRIIFGECCDFVQLIERVKDQKVSPATPVGRDAASLASELIAADPKLGDARLRVAARAAPALRRRRAVVTSFEPSAAMLNIFRAHQERSRKRVRQR